MTNNTALLGLRENVILTKNDTNGCVKGDTCQSEESHVVFHVKSLSVHIKIFCFIQFTKSFLNNIGIPNRMKNLHLNIYQKIQMEYIMLLWEREDLIKKMVDFINHRSFNFRFLKAGVSPVS